MSEVSQLVFDRPATGSWNMAVDQALLLAAETRQQATLRFYQWSVPTLSLGYFQKHRDRGLHAGSVACPLVRRRSGGGAIVHDRELTYSLALPSTNRWSQRNAELYEIVHEEIIALLADVRMDAERYADRPVNRGGRDGGGFSAEGGGPGPAAPFVASDAFLCFQRRAAGDIVMGGFKIAGSAQRRSKHALLQHGSILLERSGNAPELPGIKELAGPLEADAFSRSLATALGQRLNLKFAANAICENDFQQAAKIEESIFGLPDWNLRR